MNDADFEKKFPSLLGREMLIDLMLIDLRGVFLELSVREQDIVHIALQRFGKEIERQVEEYCLDKQRVRETILQMKQIINPWEQYALRKMDDLLKELGL
jgi:hypothetical protein